MRRGRRRPEKLSEALRRETEKRWEEDRWLSSAGGGGGCDWDGGHHHGAVADNLDDQGGEEFL